MYIPLSLTTTFLLFCSSTYVTTLATDPVPRANAVAIENPLINEKTPGSHKRHDRFLSLSNHIAARTGPAQDPTTESTDAQSNESESNQPAPAARKQDQDDDDDDKRDDDDDDDDDRHETPEKPRQNENDESGEGGDDDGLETPEHPKPDDNFNSTTTARCARQSGAGSGNSGHCVASATGPPTGTAASAAAATTSSYFSSSSAPDAAATTSITTSTAATPAIPPSSPSSSTNVPTTTAAIGAAAGLDARNLFLVWVRIWGGGAAMTATVFGTFACAVMYILFLL